MIQPIPDSQKTDPTYVAELRRQLDAARDLLKANHRRLPALEAARSYSLAIEALLRSHLEETARRTGNTAAAQRLAFIAVGGFGRMELGLFSDIDFCFITERDIRPEEEAFIKAVLYPLWDLRVELGYGVHTVRQCLAALGTDLTKATALLETRHIWGDENLHEDLQERVHGKLHKQFGLWFVQSLKEEMIERHHRHGDTLFLLEPDVKNSRGGLRDVHQILWIAFALFGVPSLDVLVKNNVISDQEKQDLLTAWAFLIDLRNTLHILQNRRVDKLTVERQIAVARELGFAQTEVALPEELLMRAYYDQALVIEKLSQRLLATMLARTPGTEESLLAATPPSQIDRDFWSQGPRLWIEPRDLSTVEDDRWWPFRLFKAASHAQLVPSEETLRGVEHRVSLIDEEFRRSPAARDYFLDILRTPGNISNVLRAMLRSGFLTAYLPEFACVKNLPRIDHYHQFTVDEHMMRAVGVCEQLLSDAPPRHMDHAAEVAKEVLRVDLLNMALLLHDVGKGEGRGHVIRGMHAVQRIAERVGLRPVERDVVRRLVANHQKMSHMALRRDIEDPSLSKELAEAVGDPETLRMLYVHTACDMRAVSEESWNEWRARLLAMLYDRTLDELRGIKRERSARPPMTHLREELWEELLRSDPDPERYDKESLDRFIGDMPDRYLRSQSPANVVNHFRLATQLTDTRRIVFRVDSYEGSNYLEVTFVARSAPGLFSNLCGALASRRMNILSAQIYTAFSGEAVDIFQVEVPPNLRNDVQSLIERLAERINKSLMTGQKPEWPNLDRGPVPITQDRLNLRPPRVDINNTLSPTHTVIEVRAPDRPGLLSEVAAIFDRLGVNIDLALIATESYQVVDVFYVTDLETNKLKETDKINKLREELLKAIHALLQVPGA